MRCSMLVSRLLALLLATITIMTIVACSNQPQSAPQAPSEQVDRGGGGGGGGGY